MSDYAQKLLDADKALRKGSGEVYLVIFGEYDDSYPMAAFEVKADAIKFRDKQNETIDAPHDRARLGTIPFHPRGTYTAE
jgi:hypothetical protein